MPKGDSSSEHVQRKNILLQIKGINLKKAFMPDLFSFFTKGRQLANVYLWKEEVAVNKDSAFPSRK